VIHKTETCPTLDEDRNGILRTRAPLRIVFKIWRRRSRLERGLFAGILAISLLIVFLWPGEPRYGGRGLSSWITEFQKDRTARSRAAISAIGEKGLPVVYRGFDTNRIKLSPFIPQSKALAEYWSDQRWEVALNDAMTVLEILGPRAKETLPLLRQRLNDMGFHGAARQGILFVQGDPAESFVWTMKNGGIFAKRMMIGWMSDRKWDDEVFELLSQARTNEDVRLRPWAYRTLLRGDIEEQTRQVFVMEGLTNALIGVRVTTLDHLARNPEEVARFAENVRALTNNARTRKDALAALKAADLLAKEDGRGIIVPRPDDHKKVTQTNRY
jgi:hypothetical protein